MKKAFALLTAAALLAALCACAPVPAAVPDAPQPAAETAAPEIVEIPMAEHAKTPSPAETPALAETAAPAAQPLGALTDLLAETAESCHPGTAGCSLVSARLAGTLLDWYLSSQSTPSAITETTAAFFATLDTEAAAAFSGEQLGLVYASAQDLTGDNAEEYLESAGYEPASAPYSEQDIAAFFAAIFAGVGKALPA